MSSCNLDVIDVIDVQKLCSIVVDPQILMIVAKCNHRYTVYRMCHACDVDVIASCPPRHPQFLSRVLQVRASNSDKCFKVFPQFLSKCPNFGNLETPMTWDSIRLYRIVKVVKATRAAPCSSTRPGQQLGRGSSAFCTAPLDPAAPPESEAKRNRETKRISTES